MYTHWEKSSLPEDGTLRGEEHRETNHTLMLLLAVYWVFCDAHKSALNVRALAIQIPNGVGLKCIWGHHFSGCIVENLYNMLCGLMNGFLLHISVQPVTRPQCSNCSLDMVHIH